MENDKQMYIGKCRYEIQEKGSSVWYTGVYQPISSNVLERKFKGCWTLKPKKVSVINFIWWPDF
jgi:hypothetical protein